MIFQFAFHALKIKDAFAEVLGGDNLPIKTKVSLPHRRTRTQRLIRTDI